MMRIVRSNVTKRMPEVLGKCEGIVSMVFEDGNTCPINDSENSMRLFKRMWDMSESGEVELKFEKDADFARMYHFLIAA